MGFMLMRFIINYVLIAFISCLIFTLGQPEPSVTRPKLVHDIWYRRVSDLCITRSTYQFCTISGRSILVSDLPACWCNAPENREQRDATKERVMGR